jgi:Putative prokaryotic signal transducing protein
MRKVFTHQNSMIVGNARGLLENAGIDVAVRNEYSQGAMGELAVFDTWPELWVTRARDYDRAVTLLEQTLTEQAEPPWLCGHCQEQNESSFEICWRCGLAP